MSKSPFFVVALPRSRTCWLSTFLSYGSDSAERACGHDMLLRCSSLYDFRLAMASVDGTVETSIVEGWKVMKDLWPKSKVIVIHRDLADIVRSCRKLGLEPDLSQLVMRKEMLDMLAAAPGVKSYDFDSLENPDCCKEIFEYLLELPFDVNWWADLHSKNIQINMPMRIEEIRQRHAALRDLRNEVIVASARLGNASCLGLH